MSTLDIGRAVKRDTIIYQPVVELVEWRTEESEVSGSNPPGVDSYF